MRAAPNSKRQSGTGVVRFLQRHQPATLTTFALSAGRFSPPWSAPSKKAEGEEHASGTSSSSRAAEHVSRLMEGL